MSIESAKAFYSRMTTDEAFRFQLQNAPSDDERRAIMQAGGYNFTPEEWEAATKQILESDAADSELSDAQLEAVSGGMMLMYGGPFLLDNELLNSTEDWTSGSL